MRTFILAIAFALTAFTGNAAAQTYDIENQFEFYGVWCLDEATSRTIGESFHQDGAQGLQHQSILAMVADTCEFLPAREIREDVPTTIVATWWHLDRTVTLTRSHIITSKGDIRELYGFFIGYGF